MNSCCKFFKVLTIPLWLDLEHSASAGSLNFGEERFPGMSRQDTIFTRLQGDQGVCQYISTSRQIICREQDTIVTDLRFVEQPPAPPIRKGILLIELDLRAGVRFFHSLLTRLKTSVQNFHASRDKIFDHYIMRIVRQDKRQLGSDRFIGTKLKGRKRWTQSRGVRGRSAAIAAHIYSINPHACIYWFYIFYRAIDIQHSPVVQPANSIFALDG